MDVIERGELAERLRWFHAELAEASAAASVELDEAIRELRGASRARLLLRADGRYPESLAEAVAELGRRHLCRTHDLTCAAAAEALAGYAAAVPRFAAVWDPPVINAPHRGRRRAADLVMMVALPVGLMLVRLPWMAGNLPSPPVCGITVSVGLAIAWWLASSRRAGTEADTLTRWTEEVLRDTQRNLESAFAQRRIDAERQMRRVFLHLADRFDAQAPPLRGAHR